MEKKEIVKIIKYWTPKKTDKVFRLLYDGDIESIADDILATTNSTAIEQLIKKYEKLIKKYPAICFCTKIIDAIREI